MRTPARDFGLSAGPASKCLGVEVPGRRVSGPVVDPDFGDLAGPHDPVRPGLGLLPLQGHDQVMPIRVGGGRHVGGARVGLGVGVAVHDAQDLEAGVFGGPFGAQVVLRVEGVDPSRLFGVPAGEETNHPVALCRTFTGQESAGFEWILGQSEGAHGVVGLRRHGERLVVESQIRTARCRRHGAQRRSP